MTFRRTVAALAAAVLSFALPRSAAAAAPASGDWRPVGPFGGTVTALAVEPSNPDTVLAASELDGIFHSADRGATWARSGPSAFTLEIVFDPLHRGTAYAGIGHALWKTADGGGTWTYAAGGMPTGDNFYVFGIAVDPRRASTLYATTAAGLYKTTDGAAHWFPTGSLPFTGTGGALVIDPVTSALYLCTSGGLRKSVDGGHRWKPFGPSRVSITVLTIDPGNPDFLYAGGHGLYRSTDHGGSFQRIGKTLPAFEVAAIAVHSGRPSTVVVVFHTINLHPGGLYRSLDGGTSWEAPPQGLPAGDVLTAAIDSATPPRVYAGVPVLGVYASADAGAHWAAANTGLRAIEVRVVTVDPERPGTAYAASDAQGIWKTADDGASWQIVEPQMTFTSTIVLAPRQPATVFAAASGRQERSDDRGQTWRRIDLGVRRFFPTGALAVDPADSTQLYMGAQTAGVRKSTDGGGHWQALAPLWNCSPQPPEAFAIAVSPAAPSAVYVGTTAGDPPCSPLGNDLFKSTDGGSSWIHLHLSLVLVDFALDPIDSQVLYVLGLDSHLDSRLVKSTDGGVSFQPLIAPAGADLRTLLSDPADPAHLYLGAVDAVYSSADGGATWQPVGGRFDGEVLGLAVDRATPGRLWAGTATGVFVFQPTGDSR